MQIGDRVAFSREFLKSTGQCAGWALFARGEIKDITTLSPAGCVLVGIKWDKKAKGWPSKRGQPCARVSCTLGAKVTAHPEHLTALWQVDIGCAGTATTSQIQ